MINKLFKKLYSDFGSEVNLTWPGSLCSGLQTGSHAAVTWQNSSGQKTYGCISVVSWQQYLAHGHASPPTGDIAPPSEKSNTNTQKDIRTFNTQVFFSNTWFIWPWFKCVSVTEKADLTDSQLIGAALNWTELVEHDNTAFSICGWCFFQAQQGFIPVYDTHIHTVTKDYPGRISGKRFRASQHSIKCFSTTVSSRLLFAAILRGVRLIMAPVLLGLGR